MHVYRIRNFLYVLRRELCPSLSVLELRRSQMCSEYTGCLFYHGLEHGSCHGISRHMQAFCEMNLPCLGTTVSVKMYFIVNSFYCLCGKCRSCGPSQRRVWIWKITTSEACSVDVGETVPRNKHLFTHRTGRWEQSDEGSDVKLLQPWKKSWENWE
jgi:hypothetical protein